MPTPESSEQQRFEALFVYRKVAALQCVPCCGMCGTTRRQTKPYWSLGMRLCQHCLRANLVSSLVLYERCWISFSTLIRDHFSFIDLIHLNVFYFKTHVSPLQRMEFTYDGIDFPGGYRTIWFFWKPHLAEQINLEAFERQGVEKHAAARVVRAFTRRALVLRVLCGVKDRTTPTTLIRCARVKGRDMQNLEFRLRRTALLGPIAMQNDLRAVLKLSVRDTERLSRGEDRVTPLLLN